jgi:hypothetical protein
MACSCEKCRQHTAQLGLGRGAVTRTAMHKAYRKAAKAWHPDRFAHDAARRHDAEERFKQIQIAFRELTEHNPDGWEEPAPTAEQLPSRARPTGVALSFGGAPGCYVGPQIPARMTDLIFSLLGAYDSALALIDLGGRRAEGPSEFLILATHGLLQRDALQIISLLSYADVGEVRLADRRSDGRAGWFQKLVWKLADAGPVYALEIYRRDGTLFCAIERAIEDRAKATLYRFLQDRRQQYKGA